MHHAHAFAHAHAGRQIDLIEDGGTVEQETRLFDPNKGETRPMRTKEEAHDYRYFPDPDLLPLEMSAAMVDDLRAHLPELPDQKKARFIRDYALTAYDANVLIAAHRVDHAHYSLASPWLRRLTAGTERFSVTDATWASFVRISTNRRIFHTPTPVGDVFEFVRAVRGQPNHLSIRPGPDHLAIFEELCIETETTGDLANDAYLAAIAIELGATLVSLDRDFARFDSLDWRRPD